MKFHVGNTFLALWGFAVFAMVGLAGGTDLMIQINAGQIECFFEDMEANKTLYVDYSVVSTTQGALDIDFQVSDTHDRPMITEIRRTDSHHEIPIQAAGFHKICFDNTFSHFSSKTVAFTISVEDQDQTNWKDYDDNTFQAEGSYGVELKEIKASVEKVKVNLNKIELIQTEFRHVELKDRGTAENNFERVNFWSGLYLLLFVCVGVFQVILVKSLFDSKYDVRRYVKKYSLLKE